MVLEPGVRLQYYQSLGDASLEPRFGMKYNITENLRFKAAGGLYSQNLLSTTNERDVVNLLLDSCQDQRSRFMNCLPTNLPAIACKKSIHGVAGIEVDVTKTIDLNVEGTIKTSLNS